MGLFVIALLAGMVAGISPCIVPILPIVLVGWSVPVGEDPNPERTRRRRAISLALGLVLSFSLITAAGSVLLSFLGLPSTALHDFGLFLLGVFGLSLLIPKLEFWLEKPFQRFAREGSKSKSAFVLGLGLGLVFVPCAGPVLAAITVLGATHRVSVESLAVSFFFATGAAIPLLTLSLAGNAVVTRRRIMTGTRRGRRVAGVLLIVMAIALGANLLAPLQRWLPSYTSSLQQKIEGGAGTQQQLGALTHGSVSNGHLASCESDAAVGYIPGLTRCGVAPALTGINAWLNTPHNKALTLQSLRGKVVLVDFWTYSCINCQRTLPHVESWYKTYKKDGFVVIGVHSPEFDFEHSVSNVAAAAATLGVHYPIAVDNNLDTWNAYTNNYWPAEYLIDVSGVIRHVAYAEGNYSDTEGLIRQLLHEANPRVHLPKVHGLPDLTPVSSLSPETYLGTDRSQYYAGGRPIGDVYQYQYQAASTPSGQYDLSGTWFTNRQAIKSVSQAQLRINVQAQDVYLVLAGNGNITVQCSNAPSYVLHVHGVPTLYRLEHFATNTNAVITLSVDPGISAYDFTFG
jgi:cytochrome c biogenesis protein CcdA/thiol-disulfide isomerase/thioredoxin